jgi:hypothetical protein
MKWDAVEFVGPADVAKTGQRRLLVKAQQLKVGTLSENHDDGPDCIARGNKILVLLIAAVHGQGRSVSQDLRLR